MRKEACELLYEIEKKNKFSNDVIHQYILNHPEMSDVDRRFLTRLVRGVLENKLKLDYCIRKFSKQRFSRIDIRIINALRIGLYQLMYLDRVPESAAVNESVKIAKEVNKGQGDFVNGILRNFIRNGKILDLPDRRHEVTYLSVAYSHPEWLVSFWIGNYGLEFTESLLMANNETPPLTIRLNTNKVSIETYESLLKEHGLEYSKTVYCEDVILIHGLSDYAVFNLPGFSEGYFMVQDLASAMVGHLAQVKPNMRILDVCAAPGGKTTHLAQRLKGTGEVISRDVSLNKIERIRENITRLNMKNVKCEVQNAAEETPEIFGEMDLVVVDAPCSGLGIIRRKPDIKYNKSLEDLKDLSLLQTEILKVSSKYVKIGGELIYSTCTLNKSENEEQVKLFLSQNKNFVMKSFEVGDVKAESGMFTFYPHIHGTDGFFIAKLEKISEE